MPWSPKERPTPFDSIPIDGLSSLHGDVLARLFRQSWIAGKKYPAIHFPSGVVRELWDSSYPGGIVQVVGALELLRQVSREEAYSSALTFAQEHGYQVTIAGDRDLVLFNSVSQHGYRLSFDQQSTQLLDIQHFPAHRLELLDGYSRALLPELYTNEHLGLDAVAPVKFFTPDSGWTWYASEFDGDDLFFGLVSGLEVELGYFSLSELESMRGALRLPVERDLYYQPKTLRELQHDHHR